MSNGGVIKSEAEWSVSDLRSEEATLADTCRLGHEIVAKLAECSEIEVAQGKERFLRMQRELRKRMEELQAAFGEALAGAILADAENVGGRTLFEV